MVVSLDALVVATRRSVADRLHPALFPRLTAGDEIRTHDNHVGNVVLYQLSYARELLSTANPVEYTLPVRFSSPISAVQTRIDDNWARGSHAPQAPRRRQRSVGTTNRLTPAIPRDHRTSCVFDVRHMDRGKRRSQTAPASKGQ